MTLGGTYVSDDWRGLDVWVGDLDANGSGPPDIVLTHDEVKDDNNPNAEVFNSGVYCGNYCAVPQGGFAYAYTFYWGGSRAFTVLGKVVRTVKGSRFRPGGMDVRFVDLAAPDREAVSSYVSRRMMKAA